MLWPDARFAVAGVDVVAPVVAPVVVVVVMLLVFVLVLVVVERPFVLCAGGGESWCEYVLRCWRPRTCLRYLLDISLWFNKLEDEECGRERTEWKQANRRTSKQASRGE